MPNIMKKTGLWTRISLIVFILLIFNGCVTSPDYTKFEDFWRYDQYPGGYLDRVIVIGKPGKDDDRLTYENYITQELDKLNIIVIPGYTIIPEVKDVNSENVKQAALETGVKAVLVVKLVGVDEKNDIFRLGMSSDLNAAATHSLVMLGPYLKDSSIEKQTTIRLEAGLFDVDSERLLWAATSTTINLDSADTAVKDFSKATVHRLAKDGFFR